MIVYPAIDLHGGKVVRLKEGDLEQKTIFSDDPVAMAQHWIDAGAEWLHVVNLDGAFAATNDNLRVLERIAALDVRVQFGGGLRSSEDIALAFAKGASRVVLGTVAVEQPEVVAQTINERGAEAVCVALDARDGNVTTHGWQTQSSLAPVEMGKQMGGIGVRHVIYTDVSRDGLLTGVNLDATVALARETGLQVIASGGVNSLVDVQNLFDAGCIAGVVIGMALYQQKINLADALKIVRQNNVG
ncbi:MAG: 1-(5-phosphoribosyl)-5-[(5-phosphoribosylamino)methylideneamino]imidazole-4-carboxamide isomerase [Phototrophicales bacterium]|nr:MAG: 1-(5-phosphoribosyl)-5-[(5-phosphoribosylamino)methylideneamino]imidazole-4-carboxamide isomerase [Phototrophicales bacterium]